MSEDKKKILDLVMKGDLELAEQLCEACNISFTIGELVGVMSYAWENGVRSVEEALHRQLNAIQGTSIELSFNTGGTISSLDNEALVLNKDHVDYFVEEMNNKTKTE